MLVQNPKFLNLNFLGIWKGIPYENPPFFFHGDPTGGLVKSYLSTTGPRYGYNDIGQMVPFLKTSGFSRSTRKYTPEN